MCVCCSGPLTSILQSLSPVIWTVSDQHVEVDVGADASVVERLCWTNIVTHAQKNNRGIILTQETHRVHLQQQHRENEQSTG